MKRSRTKGACIGQICRTILGIALGIQGLGRAWAEDSTAIPVYPGCDEPKSPGQGRIFYIDPSRGSPANDGSRERPWRTLAETLDAKAGLIATHNHSGRDPAQSLAPVNPTAPIHPGDTLILASGNYGEIDLHNYNNDDFISIVAAPGETPVISSLKVGAASHWLLRGISFRGAKPENEAKKYEPLVGLGTTYRGIGKSDNIILVNNSFATQESVDDWSPKDWVEKPYLYGLQSVAECVSLVNNHFFNLRNAIGLSGERTLAQGNLVERFGNDAIDFSNSNITISGNTLRDGRHTSIELLHPDGIQGWSLSGHINYDIKIERNRIINVNSSDDNAMQGISLFDGRWDRLSIVNNLVITNAWHGIALYGTNNADVINNTVLPARPDKFTTWITVQNSKDGRPSQQIIVRNNIADTFIIAGDDIAFDHNIALSPQKSKGGRQVANAEFHNSINSNVIAHFRDYDLHRNRFDLRPDLASPAREAGAGDKAPAIDIDGEKRIRPIDIGAFAR